MSTALIIVDAWQDVEAEDALEYPELQQETLLFGYYIKHMIKQMSSVTVYNSSSNRPVMDPLVEFPEYQEQQHDRYFFCGFHLGRCINREYNRRKLKGGIVLNMSLLFPSSDTYNIENNVPYYWYNHKEGFSLIHVSV